MKRSVTKKDLIIATLTIAWFILIIIVAIQYSKLIASGLIILFLVASYIEALRVRKKAIVDGDVKAKEDYFSRGSAIPPIITWILLISVCIFIIYTL